MNKGYAFGFLIVLLVVALGLYVAFTGFKSSRETLRAQATLPSSGSVVQATRRLSATVTPTAISIPTIPTPTEGEILTPTVTAASSATEPLPPTQPAALPPTEPRPARASDTPRPAAPPPTPMPPATFQFRLAGPTGPDATYSICCYIFGMVRDAAGNGLEGVQVQAFNEWNRLPAAATKGGGEAGQYNIPIGRDVVTWYVVVVDAAGNPISTQVPISFDPNTANSYRVDWQRTY